MLSFSKAHKSLFNAHIRYLSNVPHQVVKNRDYTVSSNISQVPDVSKYFPATPISELAPYISDAWSAYPKGSKYVNQHHYYQNKKVLVERYLQKKPHAVSLKQLAQYYDDSKQLTLEKVLKSGQFAKDELVVRMAHTLKKVQDLPFNVVNNFHFVQVYESYYDIFERCRKLPQIRTLEDNKQLTDMLNAIMSDFNSLNLPHLIMAALECCILDLYPQKELDKLISSLLRARISRRLIAQEHLSATSNFLAGKKDINLIFGDIIQLCSAKEYLLEASKICEAFTKDMFYDGIPLPEFIIDGAVDLKFYFLPTHLEYLLGECLRNSYEATVKEYIRKGLSKPEPIVVTIIENKHSFLFRISDRAGGIPHDDRTIWSFGKSKELARQSLANFHKLSGLQTISLYDDRSHYGTLSSDHPHSKPTRTSMLLSELHPKKEKYKFQFKRPLIGLLSRASRYKLGVGLAMCKVYAEYWNGDLTVHSVQGYGTDTVLKLGSLLHYSDKLQLDKV
ncbi:HCL328Wp [Eremothecium sinecaudum]|uniref:Protein-serine/threonine kinase n=1 Tax=Eremothecium sinecaudum TaxID=45286 RepID=A0A109UYJ8_9SACH|nr:HCL328Wp [Eremothecium sinecaudum]AMD19823.1 HCL328Wp [Eremothecium sinecaudum]